MLNVTLARQRRKELELTMAQVAELCECTVAAISRLEGGQRDPSMSLLRRYARALQLDPGDLLTEPGSEAGSVGVAAAGGEGAEGDPAAPAGLPAVTPTPRSQRRSA